VTTGPHLHVIAGLRPAAISIREGLQPAGNSVGEGIILRHTALAPEHFLLDREGDRCWVEPLKPNPLNLNGRPLLKRAELQEGDILHAATLCLSFCRRPDEDPALGVAYDGRLVDAIPLDNVPLLFGNGRNCDVLLASREIEEKHCVIEASGQNRMIRALSDKGTDTLNGHPFDIQVLTVGDQLQLGPFAFRFDGRRLRRLLDATGLQITAENLERRQSSFDAIRTMNFQIDRNRFAVIIGPSGAGKSTLLNLIGGKWIPTQGKLLLDGRDAARGRLEGRTDLGWVPQDDIVHRDLTVRDALQFAARLRMPKDIPPPQIQRKIEQIARELALDNALATRVGRLSGGERKRVSVAAELLGDPRVLLLDEPTSGLDPAAERQLMAIFRDLTSHGCTVVCTTHNVQSLYLSDQILVLADGYLVFAGSPRETTHFFEVDHFASIFTRLNESKPEDWNKAFEERRTPASESKPQRPEPPDKKRRHGQPTWLIQREWRLLFADWRNPLILLAQPLLIGLLVAWVVRGSVDDSTLQLFLTGLATLWLGCSNGATAIVSERAIYDRERMAGLSRHAYLASKWSFTSVLTLLQATLLFLLVDIAGAGIVGDAAWQAAGLACMALLGSASGLALSAIARTGAQAMFLVPLLIIPQIILSGYTVPAALMQPSVAFVARFIPVFQLQRLFDGSLFWNRSIDAAYIQEHLQAFQNVEQIAKLQIGQTFTDHQFGFIALLTLILWTVFALILTELALLMRERLTR